MAVNEQRVSPRLLAALALLGAWVAFFPGQLFSDVAPFLRDDVLTYLPLRQYIHQRLAQGQFPAWYPYEALGVPLPGQLAVGLFHPATWLLCWMDYARAVKWNLLLALLLALAGAYRWARALGVSRPAAVTAAFAFGFGGYALGTSSTLPYTMSFAALPWVGWALRGLVRTSRADYAGALALLLSLVLLAGDPQSLLLSSLLVPCALVDERPSSWRRPLLFAAAAALVGALICCVDVLPGQVLFADSVRLKGHATADLARFWSLPPLRLLELVTPGFLPDALLEPAVENVLHAGPGVFCTTVFAGAVTVVTAGLGVRGRRGAAYATVAVLALWLALGEAGGLLPLAQKLVPPLSRLRYPEKYLSFFWVALVPLVAMGAQRLLSEGARVRRALVATALVLGALALAAPSLISAPEHAASLGGAWRLGLLLSAVFAAALVAVPSLPARVAAFVLPALMFVELVHGNADHLPMVPRALLDAPPPVVAQLSGLRLPNGPPPRVYSRFPYPRDTATNPQAEQTAQQMLASLYPDTSGLYGIASVGPRNGGFSMRYAALLGAANEHVPHYGAWAGVCATVVADAHQLSAAEATPCLGAAYVAGAVNVADARAAADWLRHHPPGDTIAWEDGAEFPPPREASVQWVSWAPERIELSIQTSERAALVLTDELTPGWSATVDGAAAPIHHALIALRGLEVPAGTHAVVFEYHTPLLALGASLSALGVLVSLAAIALGRRRRSVQRLAVVVGGAARG